MKRRGDDAHYRQVPPLPGFDSAVLYIVRAGNRILRLTKGEIEMREEAIEKVLSFADELKMAAQALESAAKEGYGQKSAAKRARNRLTEIKKRITEIKRATMVASGEKEQK
jgi:glutamine synthetase type III